MRTLAALGALVAAAALAAGGPHLAIIEAAKADDLAAVAALLEAGADADVREPDGATALAWAAMRSNARIAEALLNAGANPNLANELGVSPLSIAIVNGARDLARLLLDHGADPGISRERGETPLMTAARLGQVDVMRLLLEHGADANARERKFGQTALMWAAGNPEAVRLLLEHGADPAAVTKAWDVQYTVYAPTTFTLGKTGIPWNTAGDFVGKAGGQGALFFAVQRREVASARALLDAGADADATSADGTSPLLAALYKWVPLESTFIPGRGAPAASGSSQHFGPDLEMARLLLDRGASPLAADRAGYTPLHGAALAVVWATRAGDRGGSGAYRRAPALLALNLSNTEPASFTADEALGIVARLLAGGADPNQQTKYPTPGPAGDVRINPAPPGSTALHIAANSGSVELAKLLVAAGADPNLLRKDGHTPFSVSVVAGDVAMAKQMVESGADVKMRFDPDDKIPDPYEAITLSRQQQTVLHMAAAALDPDMVAYLASAGTPLDLENVQGETPLDLADHQERFQESLARQGTDGDPEKLAAVERPTVTTDRIRDILAQRQGRSP